MEPQHFRPKRWIRILQTASGVLVLLMGTTSLSSTNGAAVGMAAIAIGAFTLGQGLYSGVIATEDDIRIRRNFWKPKIVVWEDIDFCLPSGPMAIRLKSGKVIRMVPLLENAVELRSMIDDTVGTAP